MNIFTNGNKIEMLTQQVNDLTERIEKLEYILRRYPPPYNPYFNFNNNSNCAPPQDYAPPIMIPQNVVPQNVVPNHFPPPDNKWTNNQ